MDLMKAEESKTPQSFYDQYSWTGIIRRVVASL
jgi:hypothetical protein